MNVLLSASSLGRRVVTGKNWRSLVTAGTLTANTTQNWVSRKKLDGMVLVAGSFSWPEPEAFLCAYRLGGGCGMELSNKIRLPRVTGHKLVGSSQGFLLSVDRTAGDLHATDPLTGASLPLPPTIACPPIVGLLRRPSGQIDSYVYGDEMGMEKDMYIQTETTFFVDRHGQVSHLVDFKYDDDTIFWCDNQLVSNSWLYSRAILSPSLDTAVVILKRRGLIARATIGGDLWVPLRSPVKDNFFRDAIFHQGQLHAVADDGTLVIFDSDPPFSVPPGGPFGDLTSNSWAKFLVESPDGGDLFLVLRDTTYRADRSTQDVKVFRLDQSHTWSQVKSIGDIALFLGHNQSSSLSVDSFPDLLQPNCIYFMDSFGFWSSHTGIFSLEDGTFRPFQTQPNEAFLPFQTQPNEPFLHYTWLVPPVS